MSGFEADYSLPTGLREHIDRYRESTIARIDKVLRTVGSADIYAWDDLASIDLPLRYALAHHVFEGVSRAAKDGDREAISAAMLMRTDQSSLSPLRTENGPMLIVHPRWDVLTDDAALGEDAAGSAAPVAVLSPELAATATAADLDLVARALRTAADAGFGATVSRNTRVVALIAELRPTGPRIRSWTTSALPVTAHLDYFAEHRYVSRELVHEAAHTELNDLFAALDIAGELYRNEATFYAPWLETERPVYGFLHGTWAFSHVALYCRWLLGADAGPEVLAVADMMHTRYVEHLAATRSDFARAVRLTGVPELVELLTRRRDEVLDGAERHNDG